MMNFLPLCKAIIQHQRMSKGGYGFGVKNNRKGLPQSSKGYDSNGYSLFSCSNYRMK